MKKINVHWINPKNLWSSLTSSLAKHKKLSLAICVSLIFIIGTHSLVSHNHHWYKKTIVTITAQETSFSHEEPVDQWTQEKYYLQVMTGQVMNGPYKGQSVSLENRHTSSGVFDEAYKVSDQVFVDLVHEDTLKAYITGLKRDKYLSLTASILLVLVLLFTGKKGFFTLISLFVNILIFIYAMDLYDRGYNLIRLSRYMMVAFTVISLILISGLKRKTLAAIGSTLATLMIMGLIVNIFVRYTNDIDYAYMSYIFSPDNLDEIFKAQLLIAGLGAIMDICMMVASLVSELIEKDPQITYKSLWSSGRALGHDVMGAMINVMMFTYLCGSIPIIALKMKMDIDLSTQVAYHMPMELYRFLLGGIGIMLAIPIALVFNIALLKKWRS